MKGVSKRNLKMYVSDIVILQEREGKQQTQKLESSNVRPLRSLTIVTAIKNLKNKVELTHVHSDPISSTSLEEERWVLGILLGIVRPSDQLCNGLHVSLTAA